MKTHAKVPGKITIPSAAILWAVMVLPGVSKGGEPGGPDPERAEKVFAKAYPAAFEGRESKDKTVLFKFRGQSFVYDDQAVKTEDKIMENPDLQDTLVQPYPLGAIFGPLPADADPGRIRSQPLMEILYGAKEEEVVSNLVVVGFCGRKVQFNRQQGAAAALEAVGKDLEQLEKQRPELKPYIEKLGGTYNRRKIAGTDRLSAHSFGIAIDLNPDFARYWRWDTKRSNYRPEEFPVSIVEIFERHGFIWGGKWSHYDSMHFEYRPELILLATEGAINQ